MYLAFYNKLHKHLEAGKPLEELQLTKQEQQHLDLNVSSLPALGKIEKFYDKTGIDPDRIFSITFDTDPATINEKDMRQANQIMLALSSALKTKAFDVADQLAKHVPGFLKDSPKITQGLFFDEAPEFFLKHYTSKEVIKASIRQDDFERFGEFITNGSAEIVGAIINAMPDEAPDMLRVAIARGDLWKIYPSAKANLVTKAMLDNYPLEQLAKDIKETGSLNEHQRVLARFAITNGNFDYINTVLSNLTDEARQQFEKQLASRENLEAAVSCENPAMLDFIMSKVPDHIQRSSLLFARALIGGLGTATSHHNNDKATTILKKLDGMDNLPEDERDYVVTAKFIYEPNAANLAAIKLGEKSEYEQIQQIDQIIKCDNPLPATLVAQAFPDAFHAYLEKTSLNKLEWPSNQPAINLVEAANKPCDIRLLVEQFLPARLDESQFTPEQLELHGVEPHQVTRANVIMPKLWPKMTQEDKQEIREAYAKDAPYLVAELEQNGGKDLALYYGGKNMSWQAAGLGKKFIESLTEEVLQQPAIGFNRDAYERYLPAMEMVSRIEGTGQPELMAYKLAVLFPNEKKAEAFLSKCADRGNAQAVHDTLLFDLPREGRWDLETWQQFILRDGGGLKITKLLPFAPQIEAAYCAEHPGKRNKQLHGLRNLTADQLYSYARKFAYKRSNENPDLANFCIQLGVGEPQFNETLEYAKKAKPAKNTPDIAVDGKDIGFAGYKLRRVDAGDPLCLWIGKKVNCCNYLGGETGANAIAQAMSPDVSLYVIENKDGNPIGKVTGWISKKGNLVFNSWERLSDAYDRMSETFLLAAGIQALKASPDMKHVLLGRNRGGANFMPLAEIESPRDTTLLWYDAQQMQHEVASKEKIKLAEVKLQQLTKKVTPQDIVPVEAYQEHVRKAERSQSFSQSAA